MLSQTSILAAASNDDFLSVPVCTQVIRHIAWWCGGFLCMDEWILPSDTMLSDISHCTCACMLRLVPVRMLNDASVIANASS